MIANEYVKQRNAERLAAQHPDVQSAAKTILESLKNIEKYLYWSLDPDEKDGGAYYCQSLLDAAHLVVDEAHAYRAALKANPSPEEDDEPLDEEPAHGRYEDSESYRSAMIDSGRGGLIR